MIALRRMLKFLLILLIVAVVTVLYCNVRIRSFARGRTYSKVQNVPHRHAALLLGTSPKVRNGNNNRYFTYRIDACAALYKAGKVDRIIVSGDNHIKEYNEPEAMRKALLQKGVPDSAIFLDYAGFRTLDSVVRAREIFGQTSYTIVSQRFHNERAIFIAHKKGIDAIGFNARDARLKYGFKTRVREIFARCKVFLDLVIGKKPHFLGESIDIDKRQ
jgi:SanA protein